jgi:hypothetical protein
MSHGLVRSTPFVTGGGSTRSLDNATNGFLMSVCRDSCVCQSSEKMLAPRASVILYFRVVFMWAFHASLLFDLRWWIDKKYAVIHEG